jgi:hypothetical protein
MKYTFRSSTAILELWGSIWSRGRNKRPHLNSSHCERHSHTLHQAILHNLQWDLWKRRRSNLMKTKIMRHIQQPLTGLRQDSVACKYASRLHRYYRTDIITREGERDKRKWLKLCICSKGEGVMKKISVLKALRHCLLVVLLKVHWRKCKEFGSGGFQ